MDPTNRVPGPTSGGIGDCTDWTLRLVGLVAGDDDWVEGRTRVMKGLFLLDRNLKKHLDQETDFDFQPYKYGPFDKRVYKSLNLLENQGLIEAQQTEDGGWKYRLTAEGLERWRADWKDLSPRKKKLLKWLDRKHMRSSLPKLLSFVYNRYPDMTTKSEIDHRY